MSTSAQTTYSLSDIASRVNGRLLGDASLRISSLNTLDKSESGQLSFLANKKYISRLATTQATAVLVAEEYAEKLPSSCAAIIISDPYAAFAQLTKLFDWRVAFSPYIDKSAIISATSIIHSQVFISPGVVIGNNVVIAAGVYIGANTVIGNDCIIAQNTRIEAGVVLYDDVQIGEDCLIHSGVVLGGDGFGFAPSEDGWIKVYQLAGVRIGRDVEIGAGTTVDRGALDHTYIHNGVKIDNQVQIAHNVMIGEQTAIAGCTAIAGSTKIGSRCTIAGLSGIVGHLTIADNTHVSAMTLISKSVTQPGQILSSGTGQEPHRDWKKNVVRFKQLNDMAKRITALEQQVKIFSSEG